MGPFTNRPITLDTRSMNVIYFHEHWHCHSGGGGWILLSHGRRSAYLVYCQIACRDRINLKLIFTSPTSNVVEIRLLFDVSLPSRMS